MSNLIVTNIETLNLQTKNVNGGQLAGHRNKIINPFTENQRTLNSVADDTYCLDRWYVLTETGNVTVTQTTDPESGAPYGIRLAQPDVSAKRLGLAQIIESRYIRQYASQAMNLFTRVKLSGATAIRYAIIEHTGTTDMVTSDVVSNWASATFTPSNFFIAGITVLKTGTVTPGAATWGDIDDWSVLSSGVKNVIIFIWSETALAQNGTLDINRPQYEPGVVATPHEWRLNELDLCQMYHGPTTYWYQRIDTSLSNAWWGGAVSYVGRPRVVPTVTLSGTGTGVTSFTPSTPNAFGVVFQFAWTPLTTAARDCYVSGTYSCEL